MRAAVEGLESQLEPVELGTEALVPAVQLTMKMSGPPCTLDGVHLCSMKVIYMRYAAASWPCKVCHHSLEAHAHALSTGHGACSKSGCNCAGYR